MKGFRFNLDDLRGRLRSDHSREVPTPPTRRLSFESLEARRLLVVSAAAAFPDTVNPGAGFDGVVNVGNGTGTLLWTGRHVLTAAHVIDGNNDGVVDNVTRTVTFQLPGRMVQMQVPPANITLHNQYNGAFNQGSDIAIMELPELAPIEAERRSIYRGTTEAGEIMSFLGYGATNRVNATPNQIVPGPAGTIASGNFSHDGSFGVRRIGFNQVDAVQRLPIDSTSPLDDYLRFDLDDPDAVDPGIGLGEAINAPGDSGGPLLIGGQIAGISSGITDAFINYGDDGFYTRVSSFAGWIDDTVAGAYDLVLNMSNHLFGSDGAADTVAVTKTFIPFVGDFLNLTINGVTVLSDLLAVINSVEIRGDDDNTTITVGGLGNVPVRIIGGSGTDALVIDGATGSNTLTLGFTGGSHAMPQISSVEAIAINGTGGNENFYVNNIVPFGVTSLVINGGNGNDACVLGQGDLKFALNDVTSFVFNGGDGSDSLSFNNLTQTALNFSYGVYTTYMDALAAGFYFAANYTSAESLVIFGSARNESFLVGPGIGGQAVLFGNDGNDDFVVGSGNVSTGNFSSSLIGGDGNDTLVLDDSLFAGAANWAIDDTQVQRNVPGLVKVFGYSGFEGIGIKTGLAGGGANNISVFGAVPVSVTVTGGPGVDNFLVNNFANEAAGGPVGSEQLQSNFDGGGGFNSLVVNDSARGAVTYHLYPTRLVINEVLAPDGDFLFANIGSMSVTANDSATTLNVHGTPASIAVGNQTTVFLRGGNDTVNVYPHDAEGNLTVNTNIGIVGEGGSDTLTVWDTASTDPIHYLVFNPFGAGTQNIFGMGAGGLGTATIESLTVNAGAGPDVFDVNQYISGTALQLNAGGGDDTLNIGNGDLAANITNIASFAFDGQEGFDVFNLNNTIDVNQWSYTETASFIKSERVAGAPPYALTLHRSNIEQLNANVGPGTNVLSLQGSPAGEALALFGGDGDDTINLPGNLTPIQGPIYFYGGAGINNLNQLVNAASDPTTVHLDQSTLGAYAGDNFFSPGAWLYFANLANIVLTLGSGEDTVIAQPNATAAIDIRGGDPTEAPGDVLILALAGAANYVLTPTSDTSGVVTSDTLQALNYSSFETGPVVDDLAPYIVSQGYDDTEIVPRILVEFSEDVSGSLSVYHLELFNNTTSEQVPFAFLALEYDVGTQSATFSFPGYADGVLPPGDYTAKVYATVTDQFGNAMGVETPFDFTVAAQFLDADVNMDGFVDIFDVNVVSDNWGTSGPTGDANHDGVVDIFDVNLISDSWGQVPADGGGAANDGNSTSSGEAPRSQLANTTEGPTKSSIEVAAPPAPDDGDRALGLVPLLAIDLPTPEVLSERGTEILRRWAVDASIASAVARDPTRWEPSSSSKNATFEAQPRRLAPRFVAEAEAADAVFHAEPNGTWLQFVAAKHRRRR